MEEIVKTTSTPAGQEYLIRYHGHYAVRILSRGYELVADSEATRFPNSDEARAVANQFAMRVFTVEPINPNKS